MKKLILIPALLAGSLAFADQHKYEISPMVGYNFAEGNLDIKDDGYFVGGLEAQVNTPNSKLSPELSVFGTRNADYQVPANGNTNILRVAFNGVYSFDEIGSVVPFAKAGAGYETVNNEIISNQSGFFLDAGAGAKMFVTENIALKLEGIYMAKPGGNNAGSADNNFMALAGLTFAFGGEAPKAAPVVAAVVAAALVVDGDDDHDGVANSIDQCIYTPANTPVDANGCSLDDDKDGVANSIDQCPQTAFGVEVDKKGCKINYDNDNDGVLNANDLCPTTPEGEAVNSDGCTKVVNLHVNFDNNSHVLQRNSMSDINAFASFLITHLNYTANIVGYTDSRASESYNKTLSLKRAKAVEQILVAEGVNPSQLTSDGMGEANPIADNATSEGRAQNRRIEAELIRH